MNDPEIVIPKEDEMLIDIDVASLYPSMLIEYGFYPKHLGPEFLEVYRQIKDERIEAKHNGNKVKNETLKLALNGLSGNLQNPHNFCYSPFAVMQIRINGQLLLLMLSKEECVTALATIVRSCDNKKAKGSRKRNFYAFTYR